jgi:hypothetical protein
LGELFTIVTNLKILKSLFLRPTLFCKYQISCSPVQTRTIIQIIKTGNKISNAIVDIKISIALFHNLYINIKDLS